MTVPLDTRNDIRSMDAEGLPRPRSPAGSTSAAGTVAKYADMEDLSPAPPVPEPRPHPALDGHAGWVDAVLEADLGAPRKQRHTAKRIYDRLVSERGYRGSYSTVQRHVREWRLARGAGAGGGYLELEWAPGTAQVDYGNFEAEVAGERLRLKLLVVCLPHSGARYAVAGRSQRAECMCAGLASIFGWVGPGAARARPRQRHRGGAPGPRGGDRVAPVLAVPRPLPRGEPLLQPLLRQREGRRGERGGGSSGATSSCPCPGSARSPS